MQIRPNALAVIFAKGKLLVEKGIDVTTGIEFYRLLGGGIEFGETSLDAVRRELKEELELEIQDAELLNVFENIFEFNGVPHHEITFLYSVNIFEKNIDVNKKIPRIDKQNSFAEWVEINDIKNNAVKLYPQKVLDFI